MIRVALLTIFHNWPYDVDSSSFECHLGPRRRLSFADPDLLPAEDRLSGCIDEG